MLTQRGKVFLAGLLIVLGSIIAWPFLFTFVSFNFMAFKVMWTVFCIFTIVIGVGTFIYASDSMDGKIFTDWIKNARGIKE